MYHVADSAVSKMVFENLLRKNLPMLSARSYAYRKDLSVQDAVRYIKSAFHDRSRLYVAEYDFSKYFDTISHRYLYEMLDQLFVTGIEKHVISGFLETSASPIDDYRPDSGSPRQTGIPQGTSISLFLANVAARHLDRELEDHGVGFVRYADDTLIWSTDYGRIVSAVDILEEHAKAMGVSINFDKSNGVRLLVRETGRSEIERADHVDYLGYRLRLGSAALKPANEAKIRHRIQALVFETLLREPMAGTQDLERITAHLDLDYVVVISRLKRYLYGDVTEREVRRYQSRGAPLRRFKGVMAAFPLVDDLVMLRQLDDWVLNCLWLAMRKRAFLLEHNLGLSIIPPPHGLARHELRGFRTQSLRTGETIDLRVPSVRRIAALMRPDAKRTL